MVISLLWRDVFIIKIVLIIYIYTNTHIKTVVTGEKDNNLYTRIHVKLFNVLIMEIENFMKNNVGIIKLYDKFNFVDPIRHYPCPNILYDWFIYVNCVIYIFFHLQSTF